MLAAVTYTTDNIAGLDVSSPVRFRGVTLGRVSGVSLHPGGTIVEINFELFLDRIRTLGGNVGRVQEVAEMGLFSNLRAMVIGNPVTGDSYLLLDIPKDPPPPMALGFKPDRPYVPMMPSPLVKCGISFRTSSSEPRSPSGRSVRLSPGCRTASTAATGSSPTSSG